MGQCASGTAVRNVNVDGSLACQTAYTPSWTETQVFYRFFFFWYVFSQLNRSFFQRRAKSDCTGGTYAVGLQEDGTFTCAAFANTLIVDSSGSDWSPISLTSQETGIGLVHGPMSQNQFTEKIFGSFVAHCELRVSMRIWGTGTFDADEFISIFVDGKLIWTDKRFYTSGDPLACKYEWKTYTGSFPGMAPYCYQDVDIFVPHSSSTATIRFSTSINEVVSNEAASFSGLVVEVSGFFFFLSASYRFAGYSCVSQADIHAPKRCCGLPLEQHSNVHVCGFVIGCYSRSLRH